MFCGSIVATLAACGTAPTPPPPDPVIIRLPPVTVEKLTYPTVPADQLVCAREPIVPENIETDVALALWAQAVREAGAECRSRVDYLKSYIEMWPKD
jgi:hypothetical protein